MSTKITNTYIFYSNENDIYISGTSFDGTNLTLSNTTGGTIVEAINVYSGLTINGPVSATTISSDILDSLSILSGGTSLSDLFQAKGVDYFTTGATVNSPLVHFHRNDALSAYTVDLTPFLDDTNTFTTGSTLIGDTIYFNRNNSLSAYTTDLSGLVSSLTLSGANGVTITTGNTVELGGTLDKTTTILGGGANNMTFGGVSASDRIGTLNAFGDNINFYSLTAAGLPMGNLSLGPTSATFGSDAFNTGATTYINGYNTSIGATNNALFSHGPGGMVGYNTDYSAFYQPLSFVTYQDLTGSTLTSGNGTTVGIGNTIDLGGVLTDDVVFDGLSGSTSINFGDAGLNQHLNRFGVGASNIAMLSFDPVGLPVTSIGLDNTFARLASTSPSAITDVRSLGGSLTLSATDTTFTDFSTTKSGIEYAANYHGTYTDRSLVDKEYVDIQVSGATLTGDNGITVTTGNTIELGGTLNKNTFIAAGGNNLAFGSVPDSLGSFATVSSGSTVSITRDPATSFVTNVTTLGGNMSIASNQTDNGGAGIVVSNGLFFNINSGSLGSGSAIFADGRTGTTAVGLEYQSDYSANFTNRSLVDKEYVDIEISAVSAADTFVTGGTYDFNTGTVTLNDNSGGNVVVTGITTNGASYSVSFVEIEQVLDLVPYDITINSITQSSGIDTLLVDVNGAGFSGVTTPVSYSGGTELTWQISYNGGFDKAAININATKD